MASLLCNDEYDFFDCQIYLGYGDFLEYYLNYHPYFTGARILSNCCCKTYPPFQKDSGWYGHPRNHSHFLIGVNKKHDDPSRVISVYDLQEVLRLRHYYDTGRAQRLKHLTWTRFVYEMFEADDDVIPVAERKVSACEQMAYRWFVRNKIRHIPFIYPEPIPSASNLFHTLSTHLMHRLTLFYLNNFLSLLYMT